MSIFGSIQCHIVNMSGKKYKHSADRKKGVSKNLLKEKILLDKTELQ